jgi:two-component system chemotaxis sensor kinase CheA
MGEPVLHLLRNSLDHGVEKPDDREKAGKPRVATLILTAERDRAWAQSTLIRLLEQHAPILQRGDILETGIATAEKINR